ncbi:MAG: hypothetical protein LBD17_06270 [Endomicrobium sp.]|nr:hypothetical protein [Endomicrobium sp.]
MFEFICSKCGAKFEALLLSGEDAKCPKCNNKNLTKQFSSFAAMPSSHSCSLTDSCSAATKHKNKCCGGCCHPR